MTRLKNQILFPLPGMGEFATPSRLRGMANRLPAPPPRS